MSVILIVGSTGAGKTTYSLKLSKEIGAAVFSIDNWMKDLFWQDMPHEPDNQWFLDNGKWYMERIDRCEHLIIKQTIDRAMRRENSILDLGFSTTAHRAKIIQELLKSGIKPTIHYLDVPLDLRWQRVQKRNTIKGETFAMNVDRSMFDYMESIFEAPSTSEGVEVVDKAQMSPFDTI